MIGALAITLCVLVAWEVYRRSLDKTPNQSSDFSAGYAAFKAGIHPSECPFREEDDHDRWFQWRSGWAEADMDARERMRDYGD